MGRVSVLAPSESGRAETEALGRGDQAVLCGNALAGGQDL